MKDAEKSPEFISVGHRLKVLDVLHVQLPGPRLVVRVDVRHERVARAIDPFADYAPILLLALRVLVGDVALQGGLGAQHLAAEMA